LTHGVYIIEIESHWLEDTVNFEVDVVICEKYAKM